MKRIVCCVNISDHALKAVEFALELAKRFDAPLVFLLVNELRPASFYPPIRQYEDSEIHALFDGLRRLGRGSGAEEKALEAFDVVKAILDYAGEVEETHLVVGSGNPSALSRLLLGSVSEGVVARARSSVTVVR